MQIRNLLLILFCCSLTVPVQGADKSLVASAGAGRPVAVTAVSGAAEGGSGEGVLGVDAAREIQRVWRGYHVRAQQARAVENSLAHLNRFIPAFKVDPRFKKYRQSPTFFGLLRLIANENLGPWNSLHLGGYIASALKDIPYLFEKYMNLIGECTTHSTYSASHIPSAALNIFYDLLISSQNDPVVVEECFAKMDAIDSTDEINFRNKCKCYSKIAVKCSGNRAIAVRCLGAIERLSLYEIYGHHRSKACGKAAAAAYGKIAAACSHDKLILRRCLTALSLMDQNVVPLIGAYKDIAVALINDETIVSECLNYISVILKDNVDMDFMFHLLGVIAYQEIIVHCKGHSDIAFNCLGEIDKYKDKDLHLTMKAYRNIALASVEHSVQLATACFKRIQSIDPDNSFCHEIAIAHWRHLQSADLHPISSLRLFHGVAKKRQAGDLPEEATPIMQTLSSRRCSKQACENFDNDKPGCLTFNSRGEPLKLVVPFIGPKSCAGIDNDDATENCPICVYAEMHGIGDAPAPVA